MTPEVSKMLVHIVAQISILLLVLSVRQVQGISWRDLGVFWPKGHQTERWLIAFIGLCVIQEIISRITGIGEKQSWGEQYSVSVIVLRVIGIVVLAPIAEELFFRGLLFERIRATSLGSIGAVALTSVFFALVHIQYKPLEMAFVLVDGLFFGLTRYATGSLLVTWLCHSLGNLYAVLQLLRG
ncbi:CPBP family intramembrane glutamic endopeptidase [Nostoc sp. C117]|uniref:CPBP family intramembrane glutamic endopeptidase n=1 Tax=Nostoc sp. C117 TaxID=3349875 RepID=UPI00370D77C4